LPLPSLLLQNPSTSVIFNVDLKKQMEF